MGFILDGLDSENYDRTYSDRDLLRRIVGYFRPYRLKMLVVAGLILLNSAAGTAAPILVSNTLDLLNTDPAQRTIVFAVGGVLVLSLVAWVANYVRRIYGAAIIGDVVLKVREDVFAATVRHDLSFFDEQASGRIVSRVT
ncbi:MAG: ABC transporter transmembrane domain-containing protein, partial [Anaerolineae bacterium]|nr:ABC transporter transmembrane domain-containing protein [Anaerolineae bacterium]